jgi:hypothetical protein
MKEENPKRKNQGLGKKYVRERTVSEGTEIPLQSLRNDRHLGRGLPYIKIRKSVFYDWDDVCAYMNSRKIYPQNGS